MKTTAIIQARMGSTRLPGKVLLHLGSKTVLEHVVQRVKRCELIDDIVIATSDKSEDEAILAECGRLQVNSFAGSELDVLARYYAAAKSINASIVIRITADCPLIDPSLITLMLQEFICSNLNERVDYLSNTLERTFPRGLDAEIFSFQALETAYFNATLDYEREHVTPFIYLNDDKFNLKNYKSSEDNSHHRWTLDTTEDYSFFKELFRHLPLHAEETVSSADILAILKSNPEIFKINQDIMQKALS